MSGVEGEQGSRGDVTPAVSLSPSATRHSPPAFRLSLFAAALILLLAAGLRFHYLGAQSFWNDEGNSARLSERSIAAIVEGTASDVHPPLYYVLLHGWRELVGESEFGLRSLSAFAGVLTVAVVAALSRRVPGRGEEHRETQRGAERRGGRRKNTSSASLRAPLRFSAFLVISPKILAPLFAAISPVLVYYSQETRMYALLALLAALSTGALMAWLGGAGRRWAVAYVLLVAAGLYTHYFFPAVLVAQGLVVLLAVRPWRSWREVLRPFIVWLVLVTIAVASYLPWLPIFLRQVGGRGGERPPLLAFLADSWRWLVLGPTVNHNEAVWALVAAAALAALGVAVGRRRSAVAATLIVVPLALMYLVGATDPAFFKFLLVAVPFLGLLMGFGWGAPRRRLWLPGLLTALVLAGNVVSLGNHYGDPTFARADYRGMAARIAADDRNVGVILVAPNQWEVFTYYHRDGAPVYPLPLGQPDPALLEPELARIVAAHDRLYVLYWGEGQRDPQGVIERWLDANTFKVSEEWVGDVRLAVYAIAPPAEVAPTPSGAAFAALDGEIITLREYTVWPAAARPGDVVGVRLVWLAGGPTARPYKVFLHLLAPDGRLVAQRDGELGGGSRPTAGWGAGEPIVDNHGLLLPGDLPPGDYELRLGLYDASDPAARLPVNGGDSFSLGIIMVGEEERDAD